MVSTCCATMGTWVVKPDMVVCFYNPSAWEVETDRSLELAGWLAQPLGELQPVRNPVSKPQVTFTLSFESRLQCREQRSWEGAAQHSDLYASTWHCSEKVLSGCLKMFQRFQILSVFSLLPLQTVWFAFPSQNMLAHFWSPVPFRYIQHLACSSSLLHSPSGEAQEQWLSQMSSSFWWMNCHLAFME